VVGLGGGRQREGDKLNLSVGLSDLAGIGEDIGAGDPLCMVHAATESAAEEAILRVQAAYAMGAVAPPDPNLIIKRIA
jgi:thymidine phosphorylase